jgi:RNA 2',3'-cyclic 3'-phosphodiesterase
MSLRLFAALALPDEVCDRLVTLQRDVPGAAWRPREALHLTLCFFGTVDEALARDLDSELGQISAPAFQMRLAGAGSFGRSEPTALWAGAEAEALGRLAAACTRAAERARVKIERRVFVPHVTLAYSRGLTVHDAALFQQRYAEFRTEPFWVEEFLLVSSWPTKTTSRYVEEAAYPLARS